MKTSMVNLKLRDPFNVDNKFQTMSLEVYKIISFEANLCLVAKTGPFEIKIPNFRTQFQLNIPD